MVACLAEYCERYAKAEDIGNHPENDSSDEDLSDPEHTSSDEEMAGHADP
jgi:ubiquitin-conjugating enzyme E2 H